jgi:hypothetical protein
VAGAPGHSGFRREQRARKPDSDLAPGTGSAATPRISIVASHLRAVLRGTRRSSPGGGRRFPGSGREARIKTAAIRNSLLRRRRYPNRRPCHASHHCRPPAENRSSANAVPGSLPDGARPRMTFLLPSSRPPLDPARLRSPMIIGWAIGESIVDRCSAPVEVTQAGVRAASRSPLLGLPARSQPSGKVQPAPRHLPASA